MAKTQPDKKETPTQKLKRELKEAEAQRDGYQKEASDLRQQIEGKLEETDKYKNLVKRVDDLALQKSTAIKQRDKYKAQIEELREQLAKLQSAAVEPQDTNEPEEQEPQQADTVAELQKALAERDRELQALRSDCEALKAQLQNISIGRPLVYIDHIDRIVRMRENGQSIRAIAKNLGIPSATVARYAKMYQNK